MGKGVIGAGDVGRTAPGVGANVLLVPADTSAADATMVINFIIIAFSVYILLRLIRVGIVEPRDDSSSIVGGDGCML